MPIASTAAVSPVPAAPAAQGLARLGDSLALRLSPRRAAQKLLVRLNRWPLEPLLRSLYRAALERVVRRVQAHPAVHSIHGTGSFFEERGALFGVSDVDLFIVLRESVDRLDVDRLEVGALYEAERRRFPFLGPWHEKEQSLIYLGEVRRGFPLLDSFRIRQAQGRVRRLSGEEFPAALNDGFGDLHDVAVEMQSLLRVAATKRDVHTRNLRFWKKLFDKMLACARLAGLGALEAQVRARPQFAEFTESESRLFFRDADPAQQHGNLEQVALEIFATLAAREPAEEWVVELRGPRAATAGLPDSPALAALRARLPLSARWLAPGRIGPYPQFSQLAIEEPLLALEIPGPIHPALRAAISALSAHGRRDETWLIAGELPYLVANLEDGVDVFPLSPLLFPDVRARLAGHQGRFRVLSALAARQRQLARGALRGLGQLYAKHEGRVHKLPFPCIYREDDRAVMRDVFHRLRGLVALEGGPEISDPRALAAHLGALHPRSAALLAELADYTLFLCGHGPAARFSNNLFRCAHQFMAQFLEGKSDIATAPHQQHLGLTVGIITRNRASDLREALESLTLQARPADEVFIVDNGSTDGTAAVIDSFRARLPVVSSFLGAATIPGARNAVLDGARHEIICFTDDDCVLDPGWLDSIERAFLRADNIGVVGGWVKHHHAPERSTVDTYYGTYHHNTT